MKLIIDENIAFAAEAFSNFGILMLMNGRSITSEEVIDADVLIVRSITMVDENLLEQSNVKFVGTATIGTDQIDLKYLERKKIAFADAKGSNADSVAEYVFTALLTIASQKNISIKGKTIGVVGVGNIGSRIVRLAESFGLEVLKNDPPLERQGIGKNYVTFNEILKSDIITFHVPLTFKGVDKTFHLFNKDNLKKLKDETIIVNTSRGAVIDNSILPEEAIKKRLNLILDVWEGEPLINTRLLEIAKIGTPHIAGYSLEGKINGTKMIYDALCKYLNIKPTWQPEFPGIDLNELGLPDGELDEKKLYQLFSSIYNIENDDLKLRWITKINSQKQAEYFDMLRKNYPIRREFSNYTVKLSDKEAFFKPILESIRFKVK